MGRDPMSVVDGELKVYGVDGLRIADASIMPRVTTGNTMVPCVVIGEQAAALLQQKSREHDSQKQPQESPRVLQAQSANLETDAVRSA
jgi:choline dehydrogenase